MCLDQQEKTKIVLSKRLSYFCMFELFPFNFNSTYQFSIHCFYSGVNFTNSLN